MATDLDWVLRLLAATGVGMAIGLNRNLTSKPIGMRTLSLVALGAAIAGLVASNFQGPPTAVARIIQGVLQGVLTGIGFIGAGVILRDQESHTVQGLTTAASVWITAALGIACGLADWTLVLGGTVITLFVLFVMPMIERLIVRDDK